VGTGDGDGNAVDLEMANFVRIDVLSGRTQIDAISAVPEPSVWALGLTGVVLFRLWTGMTRRGGKSC
jgi:hypothetical protein